MRSTTISDARPILAELSGQSGRKIQQFANFIEEENYVLKFCSLIKTLLNFEDFTVNSTRISVN
jgi:hypothetical protein